MKKTHCLLILTILLISACTSPAPQATSSPATEAPTLLQVTTQRPTQVLSPTEEASSATDLLPGRIYYWRPMGNKSSYGYIDPNELWRDSWLTEISPPNTSMRDGIDIAFSGYSGQIAYVTNPVDANFQLWIVDVELSNHSLVWSDEGNVLGEYDSYEDVDIQWGPNENSIIIKLYEHMANSSKNVMVYTLPSNHVFLWKGACDLIVSEPDGFAIGCAINEGGDSKYRVIEADGSVQILSTLPDNSIEHVVEWAYSPTGDRVAYSNSSGDVIILDQVGNRLVLPVRFYPLSNAEQNRRGLKWSADGSKVLVYGYDTANNSCPKTDAFPTMPCWMLIDSDTAAIIWRPRDTASTSFDAALSPDRKWIVSSIWRVEWPRTGVLISVETGDIFFIEADPFGYVLWVD